MRYAQREGQRVMGSTGWREEPLERDRSPRGGRGADDRSSGRGYERGGRGSSYSASSYDQPGRGSSRGSEDSGSSGRELVRDDGRRSGDPSRGDGRRGSGDLDERRSVDGSRGGSRGRPSSADGWDRDSGRRRSPGRDDYDERAYRSQRPPSRGDTYEAQRSRGGSPAGSSGQRRAPGRGGLWDDGQGMPPRRRPDASDPRARGGRPYARDPRALRQGMASEDEEEESGFSFGKAVLVWALMFLIGAGGAYGYYKASTPTIHATPPPASATASPSASPSASPKASPSASPHSLVPSGRGTVVFLA